MKSFPSDGCLTPDGCSTKAIPLPKKFDIYKILSTPCIITSQGIHNVVLFNEIICVLNCRACRFKAVGTLESSTQLGFFFGNWMQLLIHDLACTERKLNSQFYRNFYESPSFASLRQKFDFPVMYLNSQPNSSSDIKKMYLGYNYSLATSLLMRITGLL